MALNANPPPPSILLPALFVAHFLCYPPTLLPHPLCHPTPFVTLLPSCYPTPFPPFYHTPFPSCYLTPFVTLFPSCYPTPIPPFYHTPFPSSYHTFFVTHPIPLVQRFQTFQLQGLKSQTEIYICKDEHFPFVQACIALHFG